MITIKTLIERRMKRKIADGEPVLRSCWNCNSAHEHLKNEKYLIYCFACGRFYLNGNELI